ncbi:MAG: hypothetical protein E5Y29_29475, partial [Mesorhizobium sp.]
MERLADRERHPRMDRRAIRGLAAVVTEKGRQAGRHSRPVEIKNRIALELAFGGWMTADHEFGNLSTDLKLSLVEEYLGAFTTALRSKFAELWYIDA